MLVVFQSLQVVGSSPCRGYHLCRRQRRGSRHVRPAPHVVEDLAVPATTILHTCPGLFLLSQLPVRCLSKVALSGFKLNSCLPYPFLSPPQMRLRQRAPLFPWYTVRICMLKQHTPSKHTSHSQDSGAPGREGQKAESVSWCHGWDTHLGCGNITASLFGFCGSLMVSYLCHSVSHIFISGVIICFGISHFCFPHASPSFLYPC